MLRYNVSNGRHYLSSISPSKGRTLNRATFASSPSASFRLSEPMLAIDYASNGACAKAPKLKQLELCSSPSLPWSPSEEFDQLIDSRRTQGRPSLTGEGLGLNVEASFEQGACGDKIPALDQYWFDSLDKSSQVSAILPG